VTVASQAELVKQLRDRTGAGMMDCKAALEATGGDLQHAVEFLRRKGLADAAKRQHREAREGLVVSYIHPGAKLGVLVEVDCETDFVARTEGIQQLARDLAMQVAATSPVYVGRDDVPPEVLGKEREIYRSQADPRKPAAVIEKIIEGKLEKFYADQCLLEQPFIKDASGQTRVKDLVAGATAQTGERIVVKRFCRFQIGASA
jgi:elongation factor Ts